MSSPLPRLLSVVTLLVVAGLAPVARAAPTPVRIDIPMLRAIQLYSLDESDQATDDAYFVAAGVAKGAEFVKRVPEAGTLKINPKKPALTPDKPGVIWEGELADGEFAYVTVVLMHGEGKDQARVHEFGGKLMAAAKTVAERAKKTLTSDEADTLIADTLKAQQAVVSKVKDTFSREKNTDHFGGLFNLLVRNEGGEIKKRLDPIGLTFGEHVGVDAKIYTKIKLTRPNVFDKAPSGEWNSVQFHPVDDDKPELVRVKMLENEYVKQGEQSIKKTTDYLVDVRVLANGKPLEWELGEEQTGNTSLQTYWDWAE